MDAQISTDTQIDTSVDALLEGENDIDFADLIRVMTTHFALVMWLMVLAGLVRYFAVLPLSFPVNDGGFAFELTRALIDNNFRIPAFFFYNYETIPYAHPPLSMYVMGLLSTWTETPLLTMFRWYPFWVSLLTIPAFYLLSREMLRKKALAFIATLVFSLTPSITVLMLTGGGVIYGTALLLGILTLIFGYRLVVYRAEWAILPTAFGIALTVMTHAETGLYVITAILLLTILFARNRFTPLHLLLVALVALVCSAVWWAPVVRLHTFSPYVNAAKGAALFDLFGPATFTGERFIPVFTAFGFLGVFVAVAKRNFFLPLWLATGFLLLAGEMRALTVLPMAMLTSVALNHLVFPMLEAASRETFSDGIAYIDYYSKREWLLAINRQLYNVPITIVAILLTLLGLFTSIDSLAWSVLTENYRLNPSERSGMEWSAKYPEGIAVRDTKQDVDIPVFLVITRADDWRVDAANSWFSVLSGNQSITTVQGTGWIGEWEESVVTYRVIQGCLNQGLDCLYAREAALLGVTPEDVVLGEVEPIFTHLYFTQGTVGALLQAALDSPSFERIYLSDGVRIFERRLDRTVIATQ